MRTVLPLGQLFDGEGHVRVYQYASSSWTQLGSDIDGEASSDYFGNDVRLSDDGLTLAVGGRYNDGAFSDAGHVRVYRYANDLWGQLGSDIDGEAAGDSFGMSVALSADGNILAVGGPTTTLQLPMPNHARVYSYSSDTWTQLGGDLEGGEQWDSLGHDVDLNSDGTILAVGAIYANGAAGTNTGEAKVFQYIDNAWTQLGADLEGGAADELAGISVSLSDDGTILAVGAYTTSTSAAYRGKCRLYHFSEGSWIQIGNDLDGEAIHNEFGMSVQRSGHGNRVVIGARSNKGDNNIGQQGHGVSSSSAGCRRTGTAAVAFVRGGGRRRLEPEHGDGKLEQRSSHGPRLVCHHDLGVLQCRQPTSKPILVPGGNWNFVLQFKRFWTLLPQNVMGRRGGTYSGQGKVSNHMMMARNIRLDANTNYEARSDVRQGTVGHWTGMAYHGRDPRHTESRRLLSLQQSGACQTHPKRVA